MGHPEHFGMAHVIFREVVSGAPGSARRRLTWNSASVKRVLRNTRKQQSMPDSFRLRTLSGILYTKHVKELLQNSSYAFYQNHLPSLLQSILELVQHDYQCCH